MGQKNTTNSVSEKAPGLQSEGFEKNTTNALDFTYKNSAQFELKLEFKPDAPAEKARKYSRKSTSTEAQYQRIVTMLETGPKNTMEFRRAGIMSPASRIKEMVDRMGYYISSTPINIWDEWGYCHKGVALYQLMSGPKEGGDE
jgi:hypothetical protein